MDDAPRIGTAFGRTVDNPIQSADPNTAPTLVKLLIEYTEKLRKNLDTYEDLRRHFYVRIAYASFLYLASGLIAAIFADPFARAVGKFFADPESYRYEYSTNYALVFVIVFLVWSAITIFLLMGWLKYGSYRSASRRNIRLEIEQLQRLVRYAADVVQRPSSDFATTLELELRITEADVVIHVAKLNFSTGAVKNIANAP
jgi:hypothetical protein